MNTLNNLKKARKGTDLSVPEIAYLLETDISNLSKYERNTKEPPLRIILAYHILTETPLDDFYRSYVLGITDSIITNIYAMITQLKGQKWTSKVGKKIKSFEELLKRLSNLEHNDEHEGE